MLDPSLIGICRTFLTVRLDKNTAVAIITFSHVSKSKLIKIMLRLTLVVENANVQASLSMVAVI